MAASDFAVVNPFSSYQPAYNNFHPSIIQHLDAEEGGLPYDTTINCSVSGTTGNMPYIHSLLQASILSLAIRRYSAAQGAVTAPSSLINLLY